MRDGHVVVCSGASVAGDTERVGMWWCVASGVLLKMEVGIRKVAWRRA